MLGHGCRDVALYLALRILDATCSPVTLIIVLLLGARYAAAQGSNEDCLSCHDTVNASKFGASVHAPLECSNCHADVTAIPHEEKPKPVDCATCHTEAVAAWDNSLHAKAVKTGLARGAKCADCHGSAPRFSGRAIRSHRRFMLPFQNVLALSRSEIRHGEKTD